MAVVSYNQASSARSILLSSTPVSAHRELLREVSSTASEQFELAREIRMSKRDFKLFLVEIDSDEAPNDKLKAAAEDYKRKYGNE